VISALSITSAYSNEPVWLCSRIENQSVSATDTQVANEHQFSIASVNSSIDVISVSIRDLMDIYNGAIIHVGGMPLSACFLSADDPLTSKALTSLGLKQTSAQALARKNAIAQNNLYGVQDEEQMSICIAKNYPAIGYASRPIATSQISPCF
jgi:hypothetical protein